MVLKAHVCPEPICPDTGEVKRKGLYTQTLRVMKLTAIILLCACLTVSAKGVSQITLIEKNTTLPKVFKELKKQSGFDFVYPVDQVERAGKLTVELKNVTLEQALIECLKGKGLAYHIVGTTVIIRKKEETILPAESIEIKTTIDVSGKVTDADGNPLAGASVKVKGTTLGTTTNADGVFVLKGVEENATLIFSYAEHETVELKVGGRTSVSVELKRSEGELKEVVINKGYYTEKQRLSTGNVTKVMGKDIEKQPIGDPILALQGRVAGLQMSLSSGIPGARVDIQLRGQNSLRFTANNPLFIVDGIPFPSTTLTNNSMFGAGHLSPFSSINMDNIESIEVLKDADATAIYGSRGANGVILISTKKGKAGKVKVTASVSTGQGKITRKLELLNTQQYLAMRHQAFANDGQTPQPWDYDVYGTWDTTRYTDWQKVFIGNTAHTTNAQLSLSGGNELTQYLIGGSYRKETTVFPGNYNDKKSSVFLNISNRSTNRKFISQLSASYLIDNNLLPTEDLTSNIFLAPNAPALYNPDGTLNWEYDTWGNPFASLNGKSTSITTNLIGNLNLSYSLLPGLDIKTMLGYNKVRMDQHMLFPLSIYNPAYANFSFSKHNFGDNNITNWNIEPQITYNRQVSNGRLEALIGSTFQETTNESIAQTATHFLSDALIENIAAASNISVVNMGYTKYRYSSIFARIGFNWKGRYLINLTGRSDGSTKFGSGSQFGNFGAIGAGWIFSNEDFIKSNLAFISYGKLRGSYGTTGNDLLPPYQYLSSYSSYSRMYLGSTGLYATRLANPNFRWEMVKKLEFGLELGFIKDRILLYSSFYQNRTDNQLVGYSLPGITGFTSVQSNLPAVIQNRGLEFELNTYNIQGKDFTWKTAFNISFPKNKLQAFPNLKASSYATQYEIGLHLSSSKKYHYLGVDPQTGILQFQDFNGDGILTSSHDKVFSDGVRQKYFGGFNNSFTYKGFSLDVFFQFVKQTGTLLLWNSIPGVMNTNQPTTLLDSWMKPGDITNIPKVTQALGPSFDGINNFIESDGRIADASFIRLKNVSINYNLSNRWAKKIKLDNASIFLNGQNLWTITDYKGLDPEIQRENLVLSLPRVIVFGIKINF